MFTHGLIEVILYVEDMNAQVNFYRDNFALPIIYPAGLDDYSDEMWVVLDTGACKLALHGAGQRRLGEDTPMIVFGVVDVAAARAHLVARGVEMGEPFSPATGTTVCHGVDPEGNPISVEAHM